MYFDAFLASSHPDYYLLAAAAFVCDRDKCSSTQLLGRSRVISSAKSDSKHGVL